MEHRVMEHRVPRRPHPSAGPDPATGAIRQAMNLRPNLDTRFSAVG